MRLGDLLRCVEHGRLPWLGHVACAASDCVFLARRMPPSNRCPHCKSVLVPCCAKCFANIQAGYGAASSYDERGELGSAGYAD